MTRAQQKLETTTKKPAGAAVSKNLPIKRRKGDNAAKPIAANPMLTMRNLAEDMENMMADLDLMRRYWSPDIFTSRLAIDPFGRFADPFGRSMAFFDESPFLFENANMFNDWSPNVEVFERDGKFVVQTDLPGLKKDDVKVELTDNCLKIAGERKSEHEEKGENFYRTERSYGSFYRDIPLPEGANTKTAKAEFKNGVLEVSIDAPKLNAAKGKVLEIKEVKA